MLFLNFLLRVLFAKAGPFLFPGSQGVLQYSVPAPRGLFLKECKSPQFQVKYQSQAFSSFLSGHWHKVKGLSLYSVFQEEYYSITNLKFGIKKFRAITPFYIYIYKIRKTFRYMDLLKFILYFRIISISIQRSTLFFRMLQPTHVGFFHAQ